MIELEAGNLHWLGADPDEQAYDHCAHADVTLSIDGTSFVAADRVNVTGAGLFLLRSLVIDHPPAGER